MAALSVVLHAETTTRVEVHDLGNGSVTLIFGDDRNGVRVIGDTVEVAQLVAQAHALLQMAKGR
jgi:hypothetical protein